MSNETNGQGELGLQALLVSLSFTLCRQSKLNRQESQKVEDSNHARRGVAKVSTYYFQEQSGSTTNDALAPLKSHFGAWRSEHNRLTRPWDQGNTRLLPAKLVQLYLNAKSRFEEQTPALLQEFFTVYEDWRTTAPDRMGELFSSDDYPSLNEVRESIGWSCSMIPLPSGEQWKRITLISPDLAATMETQTNAAVAAAVEAARMATWHDLMVPVQHIVEVLGRDRPRIFESLIGNLNSILELAPSFDLTGQDTQMKAFIDRAKLDLSTVTAEDLRSDPAIRQSTLNKASELLASFGSMGARRFA